MDTEKTAVIILAGGKGNRVGILGEKRAKPALSFAGKYRVIDFPLTNCLHSELTKIIVPTQYRSRSLTKHLNEWGRIFIQERGDYFEAIQPQGITTGELKPYAGTADAVFENLSCIGELKPEINLILAGDHIYKMDYRDLIRFHREKDAELTIAVTETEDREMAKRMGVVAIDENRRIVAFEEKSEEPKAIPEKPGTYLVSMGIYVFNHKVLVEELNSDAKISRSEHDFGKHINPKMVEGKRRVFAFPFKDYWRDIGTIDAYYEAHMDLVAVTPKFNLYDETWTWQTFGKQPPPTKFVFDVRVKNSIISEDCISDRGEIYGSVISPGVKMGMDVQIINSVIMENVTIGAGSRIVKAIIDKNNNVPLYSNVEAGRVRYEGTQKENLEVTSSGIVVIPRNPEPGEETDS